MLFGSGQAQPRDSATANWGTSRVHNKDVPVIQCLSQMHIDMADHVPHERISPIKKQGRVIACCMQGRQILQQQGENRGSLLQIATDKFSSYKRM